MGETNNITSGIFGKLVKRFIRTCNVNSHYYNHYVIDYFDYFIFNNFKDKVKPGGLIANAFQVGPVWMILRVLAVVFAWMTYFKIGSKVIYSEDTGGLVFNDLLPTLVAVFLFAALFLPLLMEYGLLEF